MKTVIISKSRLKIELSKEDLTDMGLACAELNYSDTATRELFVDLIKSACAECGFSTVGYKVLLEFLPADRYGCIIYITKLNKKPAQPRSGRRSCEKKNTDTSFLFRFAALSDLIGAAGCIRLYGDIIFSHSAIFQSDQHWFLQFTPLKLGMVHDRLDGLLSALQEYGEEINCGPIYEAWLTEHSKWMAKDGQADRFFEILGQ